MKRTAFTRRSNSEPDFHHYLPITDDLLHSGVYVTSAGRCRISAGESYPPLSHPSLYDFTWERGRVLPEFSVMLISRGRGVFESPAARRVPLAAGAVVLLFPGVWHRYRPDAAEGWDEKWMHFNGELPHRLLEQGLLSPEQAILRPDNFRDVERALDRLLDEVHREPTANSLRLSLLAMGVVSAAIEQQPAQAPPRAERRNDASDDAVVAAAIDYIWTHSHKVLSVDDVAAHAGLSRRTLERRVRAAGGRSVLDAIVNCRLSRAERLLRETDLRIKIIVSLAGFGSMQNMRFIFQKRTGLTPLAYRDRARQP